MNVNTQQTVRELALENTGAASVFESLGIDYCCGGKQTLDQACRTAGVAVDKVVEALSGASRSSSRNQPSDWKVASLRDLIAHITNTHHQYTRRAAERIGPLFEKVCSAHGERHPELFQLRTTFQDLAQELISHLIKEEIILFPYIERLERAVAEKQPRPPAPFGSVKNPVAMMEHEHDSAGNALRTLRESSHGYQLPADACTSFAALYQALAELEADLHQHIHLENNLLFPRAIALEGAR